MSTRKIQKNATRILNALGYPEVELSVVVVDDDAIAELNEHYLNHTGPTNVISFPMLEGKYSNITPDLLGDVVISADTAKREANEAGIPMTQRFDQLLIHGILHLVGYDHVHSDEEAAVMEKKSDELMELIRKE